MADVNTTAIAAPAVNSERLNVADRLRDVADDMPTAIAVVCPQRWSRSCIARRTGKSGAHYATTTFAELDYDATRLACGLIAWGVPPGTRLALLVRPGIELITLVFALLRAGMVVVLVDPGLGRRNLIRCLSEAKPDGFVAIAMAQAARLVLRRKFPRAKWNVTLGRRWFWGGLTLQQLRMRGGEIAPNSITSGLSPPPLPDTFAGDPAAIIFTSGSTGPPKGVLYTHRMFDTQVSAIQTAYDIQPGGVDLSCFPLFALFNSATGVTTVMPEMDFSRPAAADPENLLAAANDWHVTQAFASPAVWHNVSDYCARTGARISSLRQVFSCGAPVPANVLRSTLKCVAADAKMHTPYGATECLPVATIEAAEVLDETAARTDEGAGVCVGRRFDSVDWRVIRITDEPIANIADVEDLPPGQIGELIVRGPQASQRYVTCNEANTTTKIVDQSASQNSSSEISIWHRMGDVGYFDEQDRFWYCGRKSQRVQTVNGPMFTECVEAVFSTHPGVARTALVGLGPEGRQLPVVFFEGHAEFSRRQAEIAKELHAIGERFPHTRSVRLFAEFDKIPVDVRHNSKIRREELSEWAKELELTQIDASRLEE